MPRKPLTPTERAFKVQQAANALASAIQAAYAAMGDPNVSAQERAELWEAVEEHGATIHRQSRLLAGKSKGG
jgi:hypothetical protein